MTFELPKHRAPIRLLNSGWKALSRAGVGEVSLREASLVKSARRTTRLSDLGVDFESPATCEARARLLTAVDGEARLHPLGRLIIRSTLVRSLANRLRAEDLQKRHPEIAELQVTAPVFIAGLPRTGTTLLHRLLTCEPTLRPLLSWEALNPAPFSGRNEQRGRDPRIRLAETAERGLRYLAPEFFAIHPIEAHGVEEDVLLQDGSFMSPTVDATMPVPEYSAWLHATDQTPMYRYFRRMVQLLLWQRPGDVLGSPAQYLGKTPHHLENLDVLLAVFPGARVIHTHRDPAKVVPSFCSMMAHGRRLFSDDVDPLAVGRQFHHKALDGVTRAITARDTLPADAFIDVAYRDLVTDPMKQIRRIHDFLGLSLRPDTEEAMRTWRSSNPQNKHGVHRYRLEDFGLDRARLEGDFARYRARFDVEQEPG